MPARSIWNSWKAAFAGSHSSCEIALDSRHERDRSSAICSSVDGADRDVGRVQLEREAHVVPLEQRVGGDRRDEVAAARLDGQQALRDEAGQRVVHGAPRDAELGRELVQAQLRARPRIARRTALPQRLVDLLVEVRAREQGRHGQM